MSPAVGRVERKEQSQGRAEGFRAGRSLLRGEKGPQHGTDGMTPSVLRIRSWQVDIRKKDISLVSSDVKRRVGMSERKQRPLWGTC